MISFEVTSRNDPAMLRREGVSAMKTIKLTGPFIGADIAAFVALLRRIDADAGTMDDLEQQKHHHHDQPHDSRHHRPGDDNPKAASWGLPRRGNSSFKRRRSALSPRQVDRE